MPGVTDDDLEPLPPSLRRTWGDTTTMADRPKRMPENGAYVDHPQYPPPAGVRISVTYSHVTPWPISFHPDRVVHKRFETWTDPATGKQAGRWTWQEGWPPNV